MTGQWNTIQILWSIIMSMTLDPYNGSYIAHSKYLFMGIFHVFIQPFVFFSDSTTCPLQVFQTWSKTTDFGRNIPLESMEFWIWFSFLFIILLLKKNISTLYLLKTILTFLWRFIQNIVPLWNVSEEELLIFLKGVQHTVWRWAWLCTGRSLQF